MKKLLLSILSLGFIFLFTGCGARNGYAFKMTKDLDKCIAHSNKYKENSAFCALTPDHDLINIEGIGDNSSFTIPQYNNSTAAGLQVAAEATLQKKHNYFAIAYPPKLSNFHGSLINTPEGYFEACNINTGNVFSFNVDPCNFHYRPRVANIVIETYKERPEDVLTYDANEILEYLKKEDLFDPESSLKEHNL